MDKSCTIEAEQHKNALLVALFNETERVCEQLDKRTVGEHPLPDMTRWWELNEKVKEQIREETRPTVKEEQS